MARRQPTTDDDGGMSTPRSRRGCGGGRGDAGAGLDGGGGTKEARWRWMSTVPRAPGVAAQILNG
jgi:hypothetical protein